MEKRALLAAFLCMVVLLAYQEYLRRYYPSLKGQRPVAAPTAEPTVTALEQAVPPAVPVPVEPAPTAGGERIIVVDTPLYRATLSNRGGRFTSFILKSYRSSIEQNSSPVEMIQAGNGIQFPPAIEVTTADGERLSDLEVSYQGGSGELSLASGERRSVRLSGRTAAGVVFSKELSFSADGYDLELKVAVSGLPAAATRLGISWDSATVPHKPKGYRSQGVEGLALQGRKLRREKADDLERGKLLSGEIRWVGVADEYFLAAVAPAGERLADGRFRKIPGEPAGIEASLVTEAGNSKALEEDFALYVGPKDVNDLSAAGHGFQRAVDFGWFSALALGALWLLEKMHNVTGNYGLDIILLTMMIKVAFIPLTHKSTKSMREMQKLQPQMARLKEKFKDDRERLNKEMMALYKRYGVNPLGGCLPMLLQFPVFIALYQVLGHSIQLRHAPFAFWIKDLAAHECYMPGQTADGCNLLSVAGLPVPGLVILMGASMILQQWVTPTTAGTDPTQQRMMMFLLPLIFTVMFVNFPAGLVLYWLVNNVLTIAQQWVTNRYITS